MNDVQVNSVIQSNPDEATHLTNTGVTSSNINEISHIKNKENRSADKERDKPPPLSQNSTNPQKSKTSVFITGDSMIKKVDRYLFTNSLKHQYLVKTAKTTDMYDYIIPTQRDFKPEIIILHVGTNDLPLNKSRKEVSEDMVTLAELVKTENNKIIVSIIVCPADSFREKVGKVNAHLEEICAEKDIAIITHSNINPKRHLNKSRLHLNDAGISVLVRNFKAFLTNLD